MAELHHECGVAAAYHLPNRDVSDLAPRQGPRQTSRLIPRLLLDLQNRGQLAAGMTTFHPRRSELIKTHKEVGTVAEVFRLNHMKKAESIMHEYAGPAAIGHVRYATCGKEDSSYAQPFERHHIQKSKWFAFAFNGQLANYQRLRDEILAEKDFHLSRETDTEILRHLIGRELSDGSAPRPIELMTNLSRRLDGAYNIVLLNAHGDMIVARDPLGIRPLCYAFDGSLFAAASESVALANVGFPQAQIENLPPGCAAVIENGEFYVERFAESPRTAHCFFEWIYFANMASTLDDRSVYLARTQLGEELARIETLVPDEETIVVPVPDTAKGAAAGLANRLNVPLLEGLLRNRYSGRTFIEGNNRADKVRMKYTPLPEVLAGKTVLLVEDSIVRSTTMKGLITQLRERGGAKEVHVRVACPPIVAPCFYGIDMSTVSELFAPRFTDGADLAPEMQGRMSREIGADSLRYLPLDAIARCLELPAGSLCQACIDRHYPTPAGRELYQIALDNARQDDDSQSGRTYDVPTTTAATEP
ncbi:MAG: amidophosphoribosyltransferase [Planctomycetaceae bacterium]